MMINDINNRIAKKVSRQFRPMFNRRMLPIRLDKPLVSFTFDDFPLSAITNGAQILENEGWRATYYTSAGLEQSENHHGKHFSAQDLCNLESRGHEIAGHTHSHADLTRLSVSESIAEIQTNRDALKNMGVQGEIKNFAYPYGEVSGRLKRALSEKFDSMRGIQDGAHYDSADLNELKSQAIDSQPNFDKAMRIINSLSTRPGWLTLFMHDIIDTPSEWGCTPEKFSQIVNAVKVSGADVLPVAEALAFLEQRS